MSLQEFAQVSEEQGNAQHPADGDSQQQEEVKEQEQEQQQPSQEAIDGEGEEHRPEDGHSVQREDGINESPLANGVDAIGEGGERDIRVSSEEGFDSEVDVLGVSAVHAAVIGRSHLSHRGIISSMGIVRSSFL